MILKRLEAYQNSWLWSSKQFVMSHWTVNQWSSHIALYYPLEVIFNPSCWRLLALGSIFHFLTLFFETIVTLKNIRCYRYTFTEAFKDVWRCFPPIRLKIKCIHCLVFTFISYWMIYKDQLFTNGWKYCAVNAVMVTVIYEVSSISF